MNNIKADLRKKQLDLMAKILERIKFGSEVNIIRKMLKRLENEEINGRAVVPGKRRASL